jgi:nicotinate-nucleotide pyrophosphorylase (carboxylating)/molybdenum transport protein
MIENFEHYLLEDCPYGDETTELLQINGEGTLNILSRDEGIGACADDLEQFYRNKGLDVTYRVENGEYFEGGDVIFSAQGDLRTLFKLWRISQTFLSIVCAIAARTHNFVEAARKENPDIMIATSRKTHPGFRKYELKAVKVAGGTHHRNSLSDSILVTQNHLDVADSFETLRAVKKIEIEPRDNDEALKYAEIADVLLLDHYSPEEMATIVTKLKTINPGLEIAVGGIKSDEIPQYAPYVDIIVSTAPYYAQPLDLTTRIERT